MIERYSPITNTVDSCDQNLFCEEAYENWFERAQTIVEDKFTQIYSVQIPYDSIPGEVYDYAYLLKYSTNLDDHESLRLALTAYLQEMQINYDWEEYQVPIENLINNWDEES